MGNYHKRSTLLSASHIIYEKYPISKLQSHLEMDRPEIGLQFSLLSLPRSPIKGFLSGCKARLVHTPPSHPASASFETSPGQLDSQQILDLSRKFSTPFDAIGLVSYFSLALTHACPKSGFLTLEQIREDKYYLSSLIKGFMLRLSQDSKFPLRLFDCSSWLYGPR